MLIMILTLHILRTIFIFIIILIIKLLINPRINHKLNKFGTLRMALRRSILAHIECKKVLIA